LKKSLNSDGQQFHQYQQNKQLPLTQTIEHKTDHMWLRNPGSGLGHWYGRVKPFNGILPFS